MNKYVKLVAVVSLTCLQSIQGLTYEEVVSFIDGDRTFATQYIPSSVGLEGSSTALTILNYDSDLVDGLFKIIESENHSEYWKQAFIRLRIIATVDPVVVGLDRVVEKAVAVENSELDSEKKLPILRSAYGTVARFQDDKALSFLKQRIEPSFWEGRELETKIFYDHAPHLNTIYNGVTESIMALAEMGNDQAKGLLFQLSQDERYAEMPNVLQRIKAAKYYHESAALMIEGIKSEYAKRQELRGASDSVEVSEEPIIETLAITPPAQAVVEVAEEAAAPGSAIEEPAKTVVAESTEEAVEEPSSLWLWFIGCVVIVGGIFLFRPRK